MRDNPYAPPATDHRRSTVAVHRPYSWEQWRPGFNLIVLVAIAFATGPGLPRLFGVTKFWTSSLWVVVLANGLFTLGHVGMARRGSLTGNKARDAALLLGLFGVAALALAIAAVAAEMYPGI